MRRRQQAPTAPRTRQERYRLWTLVSISISGKHFGVQAARTESPGKLAEAYLGEQVEEQGGESIVEGRWPSVCQLWTQSSIRTLLHAGQTTGTFSEEPGSGLSKGRKIMSTQ